MKKIKERILLVQFSVRQRIGFLIQFNIPESFRF